MSEKTPERLSTGIAGLDEVLHGGLLPRRSYLVRGAPGTGKTILGLHFLATGQMQGEAVLGISLSEAELHMRKTAQDLGLDLSQTNFLDLSPTPEFFSQAQSYDIFAPAEVEREPTTQAIVEAVEKTHPKRVVIDSITHFRYLAVDDKQFRRQVLSLLHYLEGHGATVLFVSEFSHMAPDEDLQFMADGIIHLDRNPEGRDVQVFKYRGSSFQGGIHSLQLTGRGMEVFPHMVPASHDVEFSADDVPSGVAELDQMLHGGLVRGTLTLITGPVGVGKSTLAMQFAKEAATRGERSVAYLFEESPRTVRARSAGISVPIEEMLERGTLSLVPVEPLALTADQFAAMVRVEVEHRGARIVIIDSIAGYSLSLKGQDLVSHIHGLSRYLRNMGVTAIVVNEVEAITSEMFRATDRSFSYLTDNIVFMRYLELRSQLCKVIGILKKRTGDFEKSLREFEITAEGIFIGQPLTELRGILMGIPEWNTSPMKVSP